MESRRPALARLGTWVGAFAPVIGLLGLLAYGFRTNPREIPSPLVGRLAPALSLAVFDGGRFTLAEHTGKVALVNFWASWCVPCREEAPLLEAAWRAYRDRGLVFVGVNVQDSEPAARAFIREFAVTYPNGQDPGGRIAIDYGVYGIPETFLITPGGRIAYKHIGLIDPSTLDARIQEVLRGVVSRQEGRSGQYQQVQ